MNYKALKDFSSVRFGNVSAGQTIGPVPKGIAAQWVDAGYLESKKVAESKPKAEPKKEIKSEPVAESKPKKTKKSKLKTDSVPVLGE